MRKVIEEFTCDICNKQTKTRRMEIFRMVNTTSEPSETILDVCKECEEKYGAIRHSHLSALAEEFKKLTNHRW